ncbi:MAG TPA: LysR substrate-binding domain-containing protein [Ramlibacter sp.]|nr:LysR substrate-binding domain-containing protein [Ramlibacter sp.]
MAASHVVLNSGARSQGFIERDLRAEGIERRVVLTVQHVMSLAEVLMRTNLIAVVPLEAAERLHQWIGIEVHPLPYRSSRFAVRQHWHKRHHTDAANRWLRGEVFTLFRRPLRRGTDSPI